MKTCQYTDRLGECYNEAEGKFLTKCQHHMEYLCAEHSVGRGHGFALNADGTPNTTKFVRLIKMNFAPRQ